MAQARRLVSRQYGYSQVAIVLVAVACYELLRRAVRPDWPLAVEHAHEIAAWERSAHIAWERPLQRALLHLPGLLEAMNVFYLAGNFVVTGAFFVWLHHRSGLGFRLYRNAFLIATAVSLVIEWRFPTAPPRLAGIGIEDTLRRLSGIDIGSLGSRGLTDPVAALPSLHAGWALGVGAGVLTYSKSLPAKAAALIYPLAVDTTVIVTGNHFVLDIVAGTVVVASALGFTAALERAKVVNWSTRRGVEQSGSSPGS